MALVGCRRTTRNVEVDLGSVTPTLASGAGISGQESIVVELSVSGSRKTVTRHHAGTFKVFSLRSASETVLTDSPNIECHI